MQFHQYSSIENHYNEKHIDHLCVNSSEGDIWIATEKVHGANFSVATNGTEVKWGKRNSFIEEDLQQFNNSNYIKDRYERGVFQVFNDIKSMYNPSTTHIQIYGEIYGGKYSYLPTRHPKSVKNVQKQVQYSPNIEFIAFDIAVFTHIVNSYIRL